MLYGEARAASSGAQPLGVPSPRGGAQDPQIALYGGRAENWGSPGNEGTRGRQTEGGEKTPWLGRLGHGSAASHGVYLCRR